MAESPTVEQLMQMIEDLSARLSNLEYRVSLSSGEFDGPANPEIIDIEVTSNEVQG